MPMFGGHAKQNKMSMTIPAIIANSNQVIKELEERLPRIHSKGKTE